MNSGHFDGLSSGQISGLTKAINAQNLGELDESVLESVLTGLAAEDLSTLGNEKVGQIFEGVGDSVILTLPEASKDTALDAPDANFFDREIRFNIDLPKDTLVEQLELEAPPVLQDLLNEINFFGLLHQSIAQSPGAAEEWWTRYDRSWSILL